MVSEARKRWAAEIRQWRTSGLTAREFARQRGLNAGTLRWWASTLQRETTKESSFIDVTALMTPAKVVVLEVVVGAACVRVPEGFDPAHLRAVVAALEGR